MPDRLDPAHPSDMTKPRNIKPDAERLVASLPESATWDDLAYEVYVRQAIDAGVSDTEGGRTVRVSVSQ